MEVGEYSARITNSRGLECQRVIAIQKNMTLAWNKVFFMWFLHLSHFKETPHPAPFCHLLLMFLYHAIHDDIFTGKSFDYKMNDNIALVCFCWRPLYFPPPL